MTNSESWIQLEADWRAIEAPVDTAELHRRIVREHQRVRRTQYAVSLLVVGAIAGIGLTLVHTPTASDLVRASAVGALIGLTWWLARTKLTANVQSLPVATETFVHAARDRAYVQLRAVWLTWLVVGAALAFLLPWWIEGYPYHTGHVFAPLVLLSGWLPSVLAVALLIWSFRWRARLRAEIARLDEVARTG